jgi:hypothetical protein
MITIGREQLKSDFKDLIKYIQDNHVMEPVINDELFVKHKPVEGLCHQRGYFVNAVGLYIQYVMDHIIVNPETRLIGRSVREVIIYDNYFEYETARQKAMNSVAAKDQTGINFN